MAPHFSNPSGLPHTQLVTPSTPVTNGGSGVGPQNDTLQPWELISKNIKMEKHMQLKNFSCFPANGMELDLFTNPHPFQLWI